MSSSRSSKNVRLPIERSSVDAAESPAEIARLSRRLAAESAERRRLEEALRSLPNDIMNAQDRERRRIAAELHDGVNQILSSTKFRLAHLEEKLRGDDAKSAADARALVERAINEVRRISQNLRPSELDDFGLIAAMEELLQKFGERTNIEVEFKRNPSRRRLPAQVELAIYRILQETLANIEQHSGARNVKVHFTTDAKFATLNVIDNGKGFVITARNSAHERGRGLGIINMRERAQALDGLFSIESKPGAGTEISVHIKLTS